MQLGFEGPQPGVPSSSLFMDQRVEDRAQALAFLLGLHACDCVLMNGRWPTDRPGRFTRHSASHLNRSDGRGCSVVDYTMVSSSPYNCVQHFSIEPKIPVVSLDHSAMCIALSLAMHTQPPPGGVRVPQSLRPCEDTQVAAYLEELRMCQDQLTSILSDMQEGAYVLLMHLNR